MVGACLTVIGVLCVVTMARRVDTMADDMVALDAALFPVSYLSSYGALRTRSTRRLHWVEGFADSIFISALVFMVVICGFITYAIAVT